MTILARLLRRWELDPATQAALPFDQGITLLNIRRIELACLLSIGTNIFEVILGYRAIPILLELPAAAIMLIISRLIARSASIRLQRITVILFMAAALLSAQWVIADIATNGRISSGYVVRVMALTLVFVIPPRMLAWLIGLACISYSAVVMMLPAPLPLRIEASVNAVIISVISQVAGWLIHTARQSDHHQKQLIDAQNERLLAQNVELDQLMAITAHDLRSPLYGLRNLFDLTLRRSDKDPALPLRIIRESIFSLDAMLVLVSRLLDAHQAEHAPLTATVSEDLRSHVLAAARRISPLAEAAAIKIEVALPNLPLHAQFDSGALAQILDNLLDNAVRFSPPNSPLHLRCAPDGRRALVAIEDCGPGIDPMIHAVLFKKFHRGRSMSGASAKAGTGMGLFIAATFAARLQGTLTYRPAAPTGCIFELGLPLPAA